jgi:suppressor for copper-sensitivity B
MAKTRTPPLLVLLLVAAAGAAVAQGFQVKKATARVVTERTAFAAGAEARVGVVMAIEPGWHTNSHQPTFEYLIPTKLEIEGPPGWSLEGIDYPPGSLKTFAFEEEPLSVYDGEVTLLARLTVPADAADGPAEGQFKLTYQACDDRSCLPPVTETQPLALVVGAAGRATGIELTSPAAAAAAPTSGLAWMLFLGLAGGLILNAMPCVLPVLSLKVLGLVKSAGQSRRAVTFGALATTAGIVLSFWALAGAAIAAKSAGAAVGWGVQFQEPAFVAALTVIVLLFSLNLWGLFEIPLPAKLANAAAGGPSEGLAGHLAAGLFATLMATPCSAPFLGTAVGFGLAQPPATIFAVFTAIGVGMGLPYLALAVFPGAARLLPKPGAWMATLKGVMGFLLAAAAVWLFYVLAAQIAPERLAFVQLALLGMTACIWLGSQSRSPGRRRLARLATLAAIVAAVWLAAGADGTATAGAPASESRSLISWTAFDRAAAEALTAEGRLVFVDVTADWCFTCKVNERLVLETPEVAAAFAEHQVIAMKADWTNRNEVIAQFLADHGRYGIPFYMLYRPGAEPLVFSELPSKDAVVTAVRAAAS